MKQIAKLAIAVLTTATIFGCSNSSKTPNSENIKASLENMVQTAAIKNNGYVRATDIHVISVDPLFPDGNKAQVAFQVNWTRQSGGGGADWVSHAGANSGKWQADLKKSDDGHWYITGVMVFNSGQALSGIDINFELQ